LAHAVLFPAIEVSAGKTFLSIPELAWVAGDEVSPADTYGPLVAAGTVWEAVGDDGAPVGFVAGERFGDLLHIWELAVMMDHQKQGLGRRLMAAAADWGRDHGLAGLTLTTFRSVPWNAPFYAGLGYRMLAPPQPMPAHLAEALTLEAERGLTDRSAMMLEL
jgi:GNAT superfamily N-acetyltransferase